MTITNRTQLKNFLQLANGIDTLPVLKEITADFWKEDTYLRDYPQGPFGDTESVIVRFPPRSVHATEEALAAHKANFDQHENVWQPIASHLPSVKHLVYWLAQGVDASRIGRVLINKVKPGGKIYRHADTPAHAQYWSRFHIVLHALPGNDFVCGDNVNPDELTNWVTGEVFWFRNDLDHEVTNNSGDWRIHMVVDLRTEGSAFAKPQPAVKVEKPEYKDGVNFYVERLENVIEELKPFEVLHWNELATTKQDVPLDMDWPRYLEMEKAGKLHLVVARDGNKVIGYQFTFVGGHFHYASTVHGMVDLYYLHADYRTGWNGIKMMKFAEAELKKIGVKKIITGTKMHKLNAVLFERLGYQHTDQTYVKII